nr:MAG TPA: replisome organizer protein [Caudoviricetes sp.]
MISDGTYITIQGWMRTDLNLSGNELIVYAIIYGFTQNKQGEFTGSAQYLADWVGCTRRTVMTILNKLLEAKLISKTELILNNNEKRVSYQAERGCEKTSQGVKNFHRGCEKTSQSVKNFHRGCEKISHNITIDKNNKYTDRDNNVHSCSESLKETPEEFFERAWQYYPNKRGKGRVSKKSKERLMSHGWDNVKRAIDRYLEDLKKDEWRQAQNGNTFFNGGYIDYLDENYEPPMNPKLDYSKTDLDDLLGI